MHFCKTELEAGGVCDRLGLELVRIPGTNRKYWLCREHAEEIKAAVGCREDER